MDPRAERKQKKKKKSGIRTKFMIESLRKDYYALRDENDRLREIVQNNLPKDTANGILADCFNLTSPSVKISNIDEMDRKLTGMEIEDGDGDGDEDEDWAIIMCTMEFIATITLSAIRY